jgi:hypothetical protein
VTTLTSGGPFNWHHGLPVRLWPGFHGIPGQRVLAAFEFFTLLLMASGAGIRRHIRNTVDVFCRAMLSPMANGTGYLMLCVFALLPVSNNARGSLYVAIGTGRFKGRLSFCGKGRPDPEVITTDKYKNI